jgi:hypothetical protein
MNEPELKKNVMKRAVSPKVRLLEIKMKKKVVRQKEDT